MSSSESAPVGSTTPVTVTTGTSGADPTGETLITAELPPSTRSVAEPRRRRGRTGSRADRRSAPEPVEAAPEREPLFAPAQRPGRRVVRIVRHVQLWSVFKVALLGGLVFYAIFLVATGLGWSVANATGQVHRIERFMRQIGFDNWSFDGPQLFRAAALLGAVVLTVGSIMITLGAAIVNVISEITGGIRFTVIETDETDETDDDDDDDDPRPATERSKRRRAGSREA